MDDMPWMVWISWAAIRSQRAPSPPGDPLSFTVTRWESSSSTSSARMPVGKAEATTGSSQSVGPARRALTALLSALMRLRR